jgi:dienelactone hydrolase
MPIVPVVAGAKGKRGRAAGLTAALVVLAALAAGSVASAAAEPQSTDYWRDPPYREIARPHPGVPLQGRMLMIHGGAWHGTNPDKVRQLRRRARFFARRGWLVWNVDYRPELEGLRDVRRWRDLLASRHRRLPLCAYGASAGGHLALMLAARGDHLDCVISDGGPTDLTRVGPNLVDRVPEVFGNRLAHYSPLHYARKAGRRFPGTKRILLGSARQDPKVPIAPIRDFASAMPRRASLFALRPGGVKFVHAPVKGDDYRSYRRAQREMLSRIARTSR